MKRRYCFSDVDRDGETLAITVTRDDRGYVVNSSIDDFNMRIGFDMALEAIEYAVCNSNLKIGDELEFIRDDDQYGGEFWWADEALDNAITPFESFTYRLDGIVDLSRFEETV